MPRNVHPKLMTHAANPLAVFLRDDIYRIFFSGRDSANRSSVGFADVDILKQQVVYVHDRPVFEHGEPGCFYSHGVSIGNCYEVAGKKYILFMGWNIPHIGHWRGDIGRLILNEDYSLQLDSTHPLLQTCSIDPTSFSYPWVMKEGSNYHMWYGSTLSWDAGNSEMLHVINYASSYNGHQWMRHGLSVPYQLNFAQAFSRPTVIKDANGFHMWFSYRNGAGQKYRIGYATSMTGRNWQLRLDEAGIDVSTSGWDAEMIEYPFVFIHKKECYMLYNGNGYGQTGFGLAILER